MLKRSLLTAGLFVTTLSNVYALPYGFYDARSVAMGNVSVATGGITTAALSNPGMLSVNENKDRYALLLPAIGVQVIDDGNVIDLVDEYQDSATSELRKIEIIGELQGDSVIAAVIPNAAFVSSGENFTWGIAVRADAVAAGGLVNVTGIDPLLPTASADVDVLGIAITEIGLPMGTSFSLAGFDLSVGITPKFVQVDALEYRENILVADIEDVQDEDTQDLGSFTTVDAGLVLSFVDTFRVGIVAKNLIEDTKFTEGRIVPGKPIIESRAINFETQYRVGAAYDGGIFTIAADMDLNERKPVASENASKTFAIGMEIDAFNTAQLRVGYQTNLAEGATDPDLLSVGVGLWLGFNVDIAAVVGEDSTLGAFVQTGFHF